MKKTILLLGILISTSAIAARYDDDLRLWVGRSPDAVIQHWGEPDKTEQKRGGTVLTYVKYARVQHPQYNMFDPFLGTDIMEYKKARGQSFPCTITFTASQDTITSTSYDGLGCPR